MQILQLAESNNKIIIKGEEYYLLNPFQNGSSLSIQINLQGNNLANRPTSESDTLFKDKYQ